MASLRDHRAVVRVLAEIAQTTAETPELQAAFDRVAETTRRLIPFDHMGVVRILDGETAVLHATTGGTKPGECSDTYSSTSDTYSSERHLLLQPRIVSPAPPNAVGGSTYS